jgi:cysteine desulfuration protein SufE
MKESIVKIQDKIINDFSQFDNWFDIYEYLMVKGKSNLYLDENIRNDDNLIGGCQSSVWIKANMINENIQFTGDSDSLIIKGILTLIFDVVNDQKPEEIVKSDFYFLDKIGLKSNLSPSRVNGLNAVINEILLKAEKKL